MAKQNHGGKEYEIKYSVQLNGLQGYDFHNAQVVVDGRDATSKVLEHGQQGEELEVAIKRLIDEGVL